MAEELDTILRLVAEGKLSPEEAEPIIDALTRGSEPEVDRGDKHRDRIARHAERAGRRIDRAFELAERRMADAGITRGGRHLRIRVTERGRQVVNLHIPIGLVEGALQFVPGLGGDQRDRVREAVRAGAIGPILDVEDEDGGGVLITVE
jgi:polyhydroxyalkanoate synthesis regulator phasin